jgi:protein-S-isoprenylcysteine O-methyltransferase Ste14
MDRGTILRVWLPMVAGLLVLGWIFHSVPEPDSPTRLIGLLVALIGLAGVILSRYTLGRSFSIAPKATALVTSGIYSRIPQSDLHFRNDLSDRRRTHRRTA